MGAQATAESEDATPTAAATADFARGKRELFWEVIVVLVVTTLPLYYYCIAARVWPDFLLSSDSLGPFALHEVSRLVYALPGIALVLFIIWRSAEPWSTFGICSPRPLGDSLLGILFWFADFTLFLLVGGMLILLFPAIDERPLKDLAELFPRPSSSPEYVLAVAGIFVGAFGEELVMRAYLIPRFERLLGSTWKSIVLSAVIFASYHSYQSVYGVVSVATGGLVLGTAFCMTRRLWPVMLAHAVHNILVVLAG